MAFPIEIDAFYRDPLSKRTFFVTEDPAMPDIEVPASPTPRPLRFSDRISCWQPAQAPHHMHEDQPQMLDLDTGSEAVVVRYPGWVSLSMEIQIDDSLTPDPNDWIGFYLATSDQVSNRLLAGGGFFAGKALVSWSGYLNPGERPRPLGPPNELRIQPVIMSTNGTKTSTSGHFSLSVSPMA